MTGQLPAAEAFLKADPALIHSENSRGEGPLHHALEPEMAAFLLSRGADPDLQDKKGLAPLHYARSAGLAKTLLSHGASWKLKDRSGQPLIRHHETAVRDPKIIRLLNEAADESRKKNLQSSAPAPPDPEEQARLLQKEEAAQREREAMAKASAEREERKRLGRQQRKRERKEAGEAARAEREREKQALAAENQQAAARDRLLAAGAIAAIEALDISRYAVFGLILKKIKKDMLKEQRQRLKNLGGGPEGKALPPMEGAWPDETELPAAIQDIAEDLKKSSPAAETDILLGLKEERARITQRMSQKIRKKNSHPAGFPGAMRGTARALIKNQNAALLEIHSLGGEAINGNSIALLFLYSLSAELQLPVLRQHYESRETFLRMENYMEEIIELGERAQLEKVNLL